MTIDTTKLRELAQMTPEQVLFELTQQNARLRADLDAANGMLQSYNMLLVDVADVLDVAPYHLTTTTAVEKIKRLRTIEAAARNLVKVKGRHHAEIAYQKLVEVLG